VGRIVGVSIKSTSTYYGHPPPKDQTGLDDRGLVNLGIDTTKPTLGKVDESEMEMATPVSLTGLAVS
jgi:hypothetical protein